MTRNVLIVLLAGVNLALLGGLILVAYPPADARAQLADGGQGGFALIAAEAELDNDAIYLLDANAQLLHVFRTNYPRAAGDPVRMIYTVTRDLSRDFEKSEKRGRR